MLPKLVSRLLRPVTLAVLKRLPRYDPWEPYDHVVPPQVFSSASTRDFRWYFEGQSQVQVGTLDEVCDWLVACQYRSDLELFRQSDFWQHPLTFEQIRMGDCDDHALWAWRKLVEIGVNAELMVGEKRRPDGNWDGHAWVALPRASGPVFLEAARKERARMLVDEAEARGALRPHFAVTGAFVTRVYEGWLQSLTDKPRLQGHPNG